MNSLEHDDKKSHLPLLGVGPLYIPLHSHQRFEILFFYTLSMHNFSFVRIAKDLDGFKIIQISDLHNASFGKDNHRLLELIEKQNPDPSCADIFHPFLFHKCDHLPITSKNKSSSVGSIRWMRTGGMSWSARKCSRAGKRSGFTSFRQLFPMVSISGNALRICATASLLIFSYTCIGRRFYSCHQFLIFRIVLHPSKRRIGKCLFLLFLRLDEASPADRLPSLPKPVQSSVHTGPVPVHAWKERWFLPDPKFLTVLRNMYAVPLCLLQH